MAVTPQSRVDREPQADGEALLEVHDLRTYFPVRQGVMSRISHYLKAVDGVSFSIRRGETLGLVGESGCGKTTVGRTILRLIPATTGRVRFEDHDVFSLDRRAMRALRQRMQIIFQDPFGSLNPRMTVGSIVGEALTVHGKVSGRRQRDERVGELLEKCGLSSAYINRYPHEFSGGQRQRVGIARALALGPQFIVCDEPVSALDVSIQSQILNLLAELQRTMQLTYLFIAHNLAVVEHVSDHVAVMYLGKIVEIAHAQAIYQNPKHPYTQALLSAAPEPDPQRRSARLVLQGEVPSPHNPPSGCTFHPRCPLATELCRREVPPLVPHAGCEPDHLVACHHADRITPTTMAEALGNRSA